MSVKICKSCGELYARVTKGKPGLCFKCESNGNRPKVDATKEGE